MTVIRPNSISGITSITAQSSTLEYYDSDGNTLTVTGNLNGNVNSSGVSTFSQLNVGTGGTVITTTAGGSVGIGTDDPQYSLSIYGNGGVRNQITNIDNNSAGAGIFLSTLDNGTQVSLATIKTDNVGNFSIFTGTTGEQQQLIIDASGRVRMPYQPAFYAKHAGVGGINQSNVPVILNTPIINRDSAYNSSNGRYTCPVSGVYQFFFGTIKSDNAVIPDPRVSRFEIRRNGSTFSTQLRLSEDGGYGESSSLVCMVSCNVNDYIDVFITDTGGWYGNVYAHFGGFLIG